MCKIKRIPSEPNLQILLETIDIKHTPLYFVHFKWDFDVKQKIDLNAITNFTTVKNVLNDLEGTGFICHDLDIFLVIRPQTYKKIRVLYEELIKKLDISTSDFSMKVYDTKVQYNDIFVLCATKIENYRQSLQDENPNNSKDKSGLQFDKDTLDGIAEKRESQPPQVLLVEDDPFSRHLVKSLLPSYFKVIEAEDHIEAVNAYMQFAPDVVFLDIDLPESTGHDVIKELKKYDPDAFVVMLSGNAYEKDIQKSMGLGAHSFIAKPFNRQRISDALESSPHLQNKQ